MSHFVKLSHGENRTPLWVNLSLANAVVPGSKDGSVIYMQGSSEDFYSVREAPEEVIKCLPTTS